MATGHSGASGKPAQPPVGLDWSREGHASAETPSLEQLASKSVPPRVREWSLLLAKEFPWNVPTVN